MKRFSLSIALLVGTSYAHGACETKLSQVNIAAYNSSVSVVAQATNKPYWVCSLEAPYNNGFTTVSAMVCKSIYAQLLTALATGKTVFFATNLPTCNDTSWTALPYSDVILKSD